MTKVDDAHVNGAQADGANEDGDGDGKKGKNKTPNMNRLLKARLQKLVDKTDDSYVPSRFLATSFLIATLSLGAVFFLQNSWSCRARKTGLGITKKSNDLNALRTYSFVYAFLVPDDQETDYMAHRNT